MGLIIQAARGVAASSVLALLAACGGGGGNPGACISGSTQTCTNSTGASTPGTPSATPPDALPPSSTLANICTPEGQKRYARAYLNENYLWYPEIPNVDASAYASVTDYFYALLSPQRDQQGQPKDRFSFVARAPDADSLLTGNNIGYGITLKTDAQGRQRVAFVDAGSPAANAGIQRGGVVVSTTPADASWFPNTATSITFAYRSSPLAPAANVTLQSAPVQEDPLPLVRTLTTAAGKRVAYLLFNAHVDGAQDKIIPALSLAQAGGAQELVLDMRYNGGGFLYAALSLASSIAGPAAEGKVFEQLRYNDKRAADTQASTLRFSGTVQVGEKGFPRGSVLPALALPRVYVLTTGNTCSASESVINSLRGVGVQAVLVGEATCGKPYGFSRKDNCGLSYFPIEFQGVNDQGFGDYANGFTPTCAAADDFENALGSTSERLLATALYHADNGSCPAQPLSAPAVGGAAVSPDRQALRGKIVLNPR
jgi:carboxyl-terminal processing protease